MLMQERALVLKRDVRGRVRTPVERRAAVVAEFERSGLPGTQFARLAGLKYPTLMAWVGRKRKTALVTGRAAARPVFVEAQLARAEVATKLRVVVAGGAVIELSEPAQVPLAAQLIKALA